jgi:hypothetical protein
MVDNHNQYNCTRIYMQGSDEPHFIKRGCFEVADGCTNDGIRKVCVESCEEDLCRTETSGIRTNIPSNHTQSIQYGKIHTGVVLMEII